MLHIEVENSALMNILVNLCRPRTMLEVVSSPVVARILYTAGFAADFLVPPAEAATTTSAATAADLFDIPDNFRQMSSGLGSDIPLVCIRGFE